MAFWVHSPRSAGFAWHSSTPQWISDSLRAALSTGRYGLLKAFGPIYVFLTAYLPSKWREPCPMRWNHPLLWLVLMQMRENKHFLYYWWIHACAELDMNFNKTVIISHSTEAPWPLHENKKNNNLKKRYRDFPKTQRCSLSRGDLKEITWDVSVEKLLTSVSAHTNHLLPQ